MSITFRFTDEVNNTSNKNLCKIKNCPNKHKCKTLTCKYCKKYGHGISCCLKLTRKKKKQNNKSSNNFNQSIIWSKRTV